MTETRDPWDYLADRSAFSIRVKAGVYLNSLPVEKSSTVQCASLLMDMDAALFCEQQSKRVMRQQQSCIPALNRARSQNMSRSDQEAASYISSISKELHSSLKLGAQSLNAPIAPLDVDQLQFLPLNPGILLNAPSASSTPMDVDPAPVTYSRPAATTKEVPAPKSILEKRPAVTKSEPAPEKSSLAKKRQRNVLYGALDKKETMDSNSSDEVEIIPASEFKSAYTRLSEDCARDGKPVPVPPPSTNGTNDKKRHRPFVSPYLQEISDGEDEEPTPKKKTTVKDVTSSIVSKASKPAPPKNGGTTEKGKENPELEQYKGLDPEIVERVLNEILDIQLNVRWTDIAGLEDVKQTLQEMIILPNLHPEMFKGLRSPPRGLLLFGPPGNGKTMIAKAIATEAKLTFFSVSASVLCSKWIGEGEKTMRALFSIARAKAPSFIFIDEVDSILASRSSEEHESSRRLKNEFLLQFDGATTSTDAAVTIMGATNRPFDLDDAARRRMPKRIYVPLPEKITRFNLVNSLLRNETHALTPADVDTVAEQLEGYSCSDIQQLSQQAAMGPVRDKISRGDMTGPLRPITVSDFRAAITSTRPSVAPEDCKLYEDFSTKFGTKGL